MPNQPNTPMLPQTVPLKYSRETKRLYCRGIDLNDPVDSIKDGYYPILENLRSYTSGVIQPRQGITQVASSVVNNKTPVHSVRRLNDIINSTWARIIGVGDSLAYGQTSFTRAQYNSTNITLSGNPLALVPYRPDASTDSWMYVADSAGMFKIKANGTVHQVGLPAPTVPPTLNLQFTRFATFGSFAIGAPWAADAAGVASAISYPSRVNTTTVRRILDAPWTYVVPTSMVGIGPGQVLSLTSGIGLGSGTILVSEVYRGSSTISVGTIIYDNAPTNTGTCTISPSNPLEEIKRNCVVLLNGATYVRVVEVVQGPNSLLSFRCDTGATTVAAGQALKVVGSFCGCPTVSLQSGGGDTIQDSSIRATFAAIGANTTGTLTYTPGSPSDFTKILGIPLFTTDTGIDDEDYVHFTFKIDDLNQLVQGRILFDIDSTTNDFTQNYFYRPFTPSDLLTAAKATQTAIDNKTTKNQRDVISTRGGGGRVRDRERFDQETGAVSGTSGDFSDSGSTPDTPIDSKDPSSPRDQTGTGDNQTHEIRFRRGDCIRVGTDWSRGWSTVVKFRLELVLITGGIAHVEFSDCTLFGGYAPDVGDIGAPYIYRYRYRCSTTGAKSNWSPELRSGVLPLRNNVKVAYTASSLPEVDYIDFQRWGGSITEWAYVGSYPNGSSPFTDTFDDQAARGAIPDSDGDVNYQPWVITDTPSKGTTATLAGSILYDASAPFDISWVKNTPIKVNGSPTGIYRVISTILLELNDCVGSGTNTLWEIPEPFKASQKLPCFWGPYNGRFFACGDTKNPGRLYFSNGNNPDATQDTFFMDVTSPSDPLQNGFIFNGRCYVFSSEKLFEILEISPGQYVYQEVPSGKGLFYRWAFCVGPLVWFLSKDGIYETEGGSTRPSTHGELFPLFPKEGTLGTATNGFLAPNMVNTIGVAPKFRLSYYDNYVYFDYPDTSSALRTLVYALGSMENGQDFQRGWFPDVYTPGITYHYGEEGDGVHSLLLCGNDATTAKLYTYGGTTDGGTAIPWHFRQASWDADDRRADKLWADFIVDADPNSGSISVAAGLNNYGSTASLSPTSITGSGRVQTVFDINSGNGIQAKNFAVDLSGNGTSQLLYLIEPSYTFRPENSFLRATQYDDAEYGGEKFFQGIEIEADTFNIARTLRVEYDGGQLGDTLTIQHNGRLQKPYSFSSAFVAHLVRLIPTDANQWKLFKWRWVSEPEPPLVTVWESQQTTFGHIGFIHLKALWVTHTSTADLTLTITRLDDNSSQAFIITNSGGVRGRETYVPLGPAYFVKGKTYKFKITQASNTPFRIYQRNTGVMLKPWGSAQAFSRWVGWGGAHGDGVAQI